MKAGREYDLRHRSHDSAHILKRWQAVARAARLVTTTLHTTPEGYPVFLFRTCHHAEGGLYLSAGVHGDEPAPVAAFIDWAESNLALLRRSNACLVPLFNPAGLVRNTRADHEGTDLNRNFNNVRHPHTGAWLRAMEGQRYACGITLHEDYDAQGLYAYEVSRDPVLSTQPFLQKAERLLPRDARARIDGFPAKSGVIKRSRIPKNLPGLPEALVIFQHHAPASFTFETPSEFSLGQRVAAQQAIIDTAFQLHA